MVEHKRSYEIEAVDEATARKLYEAGEFDPETGDDDYLSWEETGIIERVDELVLDELTGRWEVKSETVPPIPEGGSEDKPYVVLSSDEYGTEWFGPYDSVIEARANIEYIRASADILEDRVQRTFTVEWFDARPETRLRRESVIDPVGFATPSALRPRSGGRSWLESVEDVGLDKMKLKDRDVETGETSGGRSFRSRIKVASTTRGYSFEWSVEAVDTDDASAVKRALDASDGLYEALTGRYVGSTSETG
jgi:hypothetical protein